MKRIRRTTSQSKTRELNKIRRAYLEANPANKRELKQLALKLATCIKRDKSKERKS